MNKRLIDIKELAKYLNIKDRTIYQYVQKGIIPHYRIGGGSKGIIRFDYNQIDKWLETQYVSKSEQLH
jgi:excisionase family DNA binding protein